MAATRSLCQIILTNKRFSVHYPDRWDANGFDICESKRNNSDARCDSASVSKARWCLTWS